MSKHFFDYDDGDFAYTVSDNMAIDSDGNMMMRMRRHNKSHPTFFGRVAELTMSNRQTGIGFIEVFANTPYLQGVHHTHISGDHNDQ